MEHASEKMVEELKRLCLSYGLYINETTELLCKKHFELLLKWNEKISLTRLVKPEDAALLHYFESLFGASLLETSIKSLADIGSGAGFPGLPIAFARPYLEVTLIESDRRKAGFLGEVRRNFGLKIKVEQQRFEAVEPKFDAVAVRAIEQFDAHISSIFDFASTSHQLLLFLSEDSAKKVLQNRPPEWIGEIVKIPQSRERTLLNLKRFT
ncbi:MAG: 16S rRNA (guanine(527)-N(7))-methyltransferase RsmG [Blastocatellia bacterium]|nr:16S rRNA (guanine(527)-N(7))-methyltransferase RsmG [Blastocatellia bacterium]